MRCTIQPMEMPLESIVRILSPHKGFKVKTYEMASSSNFHNTTQGRRLECGAILATSTDVQFWLE
jgi:hypothetical protein